MDTRRKIKSFTELHSLLRENSWTAVVGAFDPVTAEALEFIQQARTPGRKLLVVVRPEPDELLSAESRAILLAGVRFVDSVYVAQTTEWRSLVDSGSVPVIEDEGAHRRRDEFEAMVASKEAASPKA